MARFVVRLLTPSAAPSSPTTHAEHLTLSELRDRVNLHSPLLVKELHETTLRQIQSETGRQTRLDGKATSLLTATGLSLTVAFAFGGQILIAHADKLKAYGHRWWIAVVVTYSLAVLSGLFASFFATWALRVHGAHGTVSEDNVFNDDVLKAADQADAEHSDDPVKAAAARDVGLTNYRRYITIHLWHIVQVQHQIQEKKASIIRYGQLCFMAFLVSLVIICGFMVISIL
jgi:hypothetical protein